MINEKTLPNFLIIGTAKAETTALYKYLQQHPQIYMTPIKETNFLAVEGQDINFQGIEDEALKDFSITDLATYQAQFEDLKANTITLKDIFSWLGLVGSAV